MNPWSIDARESIKDVSNIDDAFIEETNEIKTFLHKDRYYFVTGTKGSGKSLLLLSKRKISKGMECIIPKDNLLDVPELRIDSLSQDTISLLYDEDTMSLLWSISIILAILKNLKVTDNILKKNEGSESLRDLLKREKYTVSSYFSEILTSMSRRQFFNELINDYNNILIHEAQTANKNVVIFIDNVDECFEKAPLDIWYATQSGLVKAIYKLVRYNHKFKLFASIRKEAFLKLKQGTEMFRQYEGVSLDISYSKDELKEIFIKNIRKEDSQNLLDENAKDPIYSFLGINKIIHGYVNEEEDIFDYIYRHTLKRPRDLMEIGRAISRCPVSERDPTKSPKRIKDIINETGTKIAEAYIQEISPHLMIKFDKVFELIDSNVLKKERVKEICIKFNSDDAECYRTDCNCKSCKKTHIFCELYKIGLLGYVNVEKVERDKYVQEFTKVGEKTFNEVGLLPESTHYLIHPVLDELIRRRNSQYKHHIDEANIVGYERPWKTNKPVQQIKSIDKAKIKVVPPFKLDTTTPRIIDKNSNTVPLNNTHWLVLKALFEKIGRERIGILTDSLIATIINEAKGKNDEKCTDKKIAEQFARGLRKHLKKWGIDDRNAIIKRTEGGFVAGASWDENPFIYGSEVSVLYTDKELYKQDVTIKKREGKWTQT